MNERGQTTILVLGMTLLSFAVAGLAVDGTRAWLYRRTLQNAADAAALAGAAELDRAAYYATGGESVTLDEEASERVAKRWLSGHYDATASIVIARDLVIVEMRGGIATSFLSLAGIDTIPVAVRADAAPIPGNP